MKGALRFGSAVFGGILIAVLLTAALEVLGHKLYPPPSDSIRPNGTLVRDFMARMPTGALVYVLAAWTVSTFVGCLVGALIAGLRPLLCVGIVGGVILSLTIFNLTVLPHPWWFVLSAVLAIPLAAYGAGRTAAAIS